ncbi:MAG: DUF3137 domain-containing protein [Bacillota bacterium]
MDNILEPLNKKKKVSEILMATGGFVLIGGVLLFITGNTFIVMIVGAVLLFIGLAYFNHVGTIFKRKVLKKHLEEKIENCVYAPKKGLNKHEIMNTEFLKRPDRIKSEDYLAGELDGVKFVSSDVVLQERQVTHTSKGTRTRYVTYFHGRVFRFDFNKEFKGAVQVLESYRPKTRRNFEKVSLESIDFNKTYKTYATDAHTAFYILTPHFMESLMSLEKKHPGNLGFSFLESHLHVAIHNRKSSFSIRPFSKLDTSLLKRFDEDLNIIYDIVDDLKLNKDIFKEEE